MTNLSEHLLEAVNIQKSYRQAAAVLNILKGIDVKIKKGEVVSIVGPSGAGKSTLLHIMGGLDRPNEGRMIFDGEDLYALNDAERARVRNHKIGFVFQFYHLLPEFTALENVILPAFIREDHSRMKRFEAQGMALLSRVGLQSRAAHKPHQLSGGEQQRVAIARALINEPKIIFCDEPTGNLDSESGRAIIELLMSLNKDNRQTLVIVTHDEEIARLSHRVVPIRDGSLV